MLKFDLKHIKECELGQEGLLGRDEAAGGSSSGRQLRMPRLHAIERKLGRTASGSGE
jgi:hypothetical protein